MVELQLEYPVLSERAERGFALLESGAIELVDLVFSDIAGGAKTLTVPASSLKESLRSGYRFDGSAVMGGPRQVELDLLLAPDPSTLTVTQHQKSGESRARLCCSVLRRDGTTFDGDPRSVLTRTLSEASDHGLDVHVGIEMEFYLLRGDVTGLVAARDSAGYFDVGEDAVSRTRDAVVTELQQIGIGVGGSHHETGPGQEELDLIPTGALEMADQLILVRHIVKTIALRYGLRATFMPKPFSDAPGSGMHMFQQFLDNQHGSDVLADESQTLSTLAYQVIAGQVNHANGMSLVLSPTVNSYKRLNAGHRAPRHASWAHVSQSSMLRVPTWREGEAAALELRSADPLANPYLAFAVTIASALEGIDQNDEPPEPLEESFSSYDEEGYQRIGVPRLPSTLGEAIHAFSQDRLIQNTVGPYVADHLVATKTAEWEEYRSDVGLWEQTRYADA